MQSPKLLQNTLLYQLQIGQHPKRIFFLFNHVIATVELEEIMNMKSLKEILVTEYPSCGNLSDQAAKLKCFHQ